MTTRKTLAVLAAGLLFGPAATFGATMHELLIGTYTSEGSDGIHRYRFNAETGRIDEQPLQVVKSHNPSWLVLSPDRQRLFAVNENGEKSFDPIGRVSSYARDTGSGDLRPVDKVKTLGDQPTHASLSPDGKYLFVANYSADGDPAGSLAVVPVAADGELSPVTQLSAYQGSGVVHERQSASHVHSVVPSPDGDYLFVSDLGADRVFVYRYDPLRRERPLRALPAAMYAAPPGSGPRHLVFSPDGRQAYLTLEMAAQVIRFDYRSGKLLRRQLVSLLAENEGGKHSAAAVHPSPDGRFLYVTDRGDVNRLLVFAIDADGTLREIQRRSTEGEEPREFSLSPDGRHVLVANQLSDEVVVIERDPESGMLGETVQHLPISRPSHLLFAD